LYGSRLSEEKKVFDLLVMLFRFDTFGNVILEAMSCGAAPGRRVHTISNPALESLTNRYNRSDKSKPVSQK
jgi:hypothetical protein